MPIDPAQCWSQTMPCPICGGTQQDPQGVGLRCHGWLLDSGKVAMCSREEYAGRLPASRTRVYTHRLGVPCPCGAPHPKLAAPYQKPRP